MSRKGLRQTESKIMRQRAQQGPLRQFAVYHYRTGAHVGNYYVMDFVLRIAEPFGLKARETQNVIDMECYQSMKIAGLQIKRVK